MAKKRIPVIARDGNVNSLNSDMTSEVLYEIPNANMSDKPFLMDVSDRGHAEILDELTDLSANKGAYALREVYSNAHDATVRAGDMSRPIEITIPTVAAATNSLAEKLAMASATTGVEIEYAYVTDHGIGMTEYDLRTYFTQYGGSNKRDDAASVGSKGLGSKAPLSVADFFDVVTSKDGVRTSMHLWRAEDGNYAEVTSSEPCPIDETGTTVKIPVMNPTIGSQMLECAEEIARYNSDANLFVNGKQTSSTLNCEVGSVSCIDGHSYVHVGNVQIGVSQDGSPVSVPAWLSADIFGGRLLPWTSGRTDSRLDVGDGGVRAVLCGIGYKLVAEKERRSYYYAGYSPKSHPACIIEIEPGYLNFTVSRDEIKDDSRKRAMVEALSLAIDDLNLWPVAIRRCAHDFDNLRNILSNRYLRKTDEGWKIVETFTDLALGDGYVLTDDDIELFNDADGHSMLPLLATFDGCDPDGHQARLLAWFSSARNGKSARFHLALPNPHSDLHADANNWNSDMFGWKHGTNPSRGSEGSNSFSPNITVIHDVVKDLPYAQIASVVREDFDPNWSIMVIGGVDEASFAKAEHSIRRHVAYAMGNSVLNERILYVLCDGPVSDTPGEPGCLSESELALLGIMRRHVEVAMLDELAKRCAKEDRERKSTENKKATRKGPKPLGSFYCKVADIDSDKFPTVEDAVVATKEQDGVPSVSTDTLSRSLVNLDELEDTDLVVIGRPDTDLACSTISMQAIVLQKLGLLDGKYNRVIFVPTSHDGSEHVKGTALYAPQVKRLGRQATVLADLRKDWSVERVEGVFDSCPAIIDGGIDIDKAGIVPNEDIIVLMATRDRFVGFGGEWLVTSMKGSIELAEKAFSLVGKDNKFVTSVLRIQTQNPKAKAFVEWMDSVWGVITAYPLSSAIGNSEDSEVAGFLEVMMNGVMRAATDEYERAIGHVA